MTANSQTETTAVAIVDKPFDLSPRTFEQALTFADYLADSDLVPKDFKGKPGNCLIAMQWGSELGLKPLQAMQNLAIINGRPSLWGDAVIALVRGSALCEFVIETDDGQAATCRVKRRGEPEQSRTFSMADATAAGLAGKAGPWSQYPKRMRQMRARAFALRDVFPDVLRGLPVAEELMDTPPPEKHMGPADVVPAGAAGAAAPSPSPAPAVAAWTDEDLAKRETKIKEFYGKGKTAEDIIAFYSSKAALSDSHQQRIRDLEPAAPAAQQQAQDVTPKVTYAVVASAIAAAQDHDQLDAAKAQIPGVADEGQRKELTDLAAKRGDELAF